MASIPGSRYDVFVNSSQTINFGVTSDPNNVPPPVGGDFNLEVIVNATGFNQGYATASGYDGLAVLSNDGHTLTLAHGNFRVVDSGSNDAIFLGDGGETIVGASGDAIYGGSRDGHSLDG